VETERLSAHHPESFERAVQVLRRGGLVAFPTDTVYGLGADINNSRAIKRLYEVKERTFEKPIPILLASADKVQLVAKELPAAASLLAQRFWPGPLTLVVWRQPSLPPELGGSGTVGLRVPDHPVALTLLHATGPLAVTSANRSEHKSTRSADEVLAGLNGRFELLLDGGVTPGGEPSTVVDCTLDEPSILREGPIPEKDILAALA
jgi:L-threonylcarbamoyladenylate synthase